MFYIFININEVIIQTYKQILQKGINKLLSEESKVPERGLKLEKVAASATYKQSQQYEPVLTSKVSLFIQFIES